MPENAHPAGRSCRPPGLHPDRAPDYDTDWDSEAYLTVSGQNSNNTVRVTDDFLEPCSRTATGSCTAAPTGKVAKTPAGARALGPDRARRLGLRRPGLQYDTTINEWHTCPSRGRINASNPCSEYMFLDDTACNLASLNLMPFRNDDGGVRRRRLRPRRAALDHRARDLGA